MAYKLHLYWLAEDATPLHLLSVNVGRHVARTDWGLSQYAGRVLKNPTHRLMQVPMPVAAHCFAADCPRRDHVIVAAGQPFMRVYKHRAIGYWTRFLPNGEGVAAYVVVVCKDKLACTDSAFLRMSDVAPPAAPGLCSHCGGDGSGVGCSDGCGLRRYCTPAHRTADCQAHDHERKLLHESAERQTWRRQARQQRQQPPAPTPRQCGACGTAETPEAPLMQCARCRAVLYCGPVCQRADWPQHKAACGHSAHTQQ